MVMLLCSMCVVCFAKLEQPTDDRWVIIGGDNNGQETWFDIDSIRFENSKEIGHDQHKASQICFMNNDHKTEVTAMILTEFDFECRTIRRISIALYDKNHEFLGNYPGDISGQPVIPGSMGEDLIILLKEMYEIRSDKEEYYTYIRKLKDFTDDYKKEKNL